MPRTTRKLRNKSIHRVVKKTGKVMKKNAYKRTRFLRTLENNPTFRKSLRRKQLGGGDKDIVIADHPERIEKYTNSMWKWGLVGFRVDNNAFDCLDKYRNLLDFYHLSEKGDTLEWLGKYLYHIRADP